MEFLAYVVKEILTLRPFRPPKNFRDLELHLNIKIYKNILHVVFLSGLDPFAMVKAKKIQKSAKYGTP